MDAPLSTCTVEEQRSVIRFLWSEGVKSSEIKGHSNKLFSRGHQQACGQVDQVCCEAGGLCRKIRHKQFL